MPACGHDGYCKHTWSQNMKSFSLHFSPTTIQQWPHDHRSCIPSPITLHTKWNLSSPTSYLNPEDSNLINRTLKDYDDVSGHFHRGNYYYFSLTQWHSPWTPSKCAFWDERMSWAPEHFWMKTDRCVFIRGERGVWERSLLDVNESEHLHVHIMMMMMNRGHKLMSLTYCTYLFLCVTLSHYALMGIKRPRWYQGMHYMVKNKTKQQNEQKTHDTTIDLE